MKVLSLVLVLAMCVSAFGVSAFAANYDDYADADTVAEYPENETAIDVVTGLNIIGGDDNGNLNLDEGLTRAEAAKILTVVDAGTKAAAAINSSTTPTNYSDVNGHWASGYIAYCTAKNFLNGTGSGNFEPDNELTGYAFGKMMLNVMGVGLRKVIVDGTSVIENDYVGDLWAAKVLADGTELGLFDNVDCDLAGPICRADAMQIVYNMLYINELGTYASKKPAYVGVANDVAAEFETKHDSTKTDVFGRPQTTVYDAEGEKITTYEDAPVLTYTKGVSSGDIYKALGLTDNATAATKKDGQDATSTAIDKNSPATVGGNGILTEVYKIVTVTKTAGTKTVNVSYKIVQVEDFFGEISKFEAGKPGEKNKITVKGVGTFETDVYSKADVKTKVIYTIANGEIQTVDTADSFSGKPSQAKETTMGRDKVYTTIVDGETYEYHAAKTNSYSQTAVGTAGGLEVTYYQDSYGYVIAEDSVTAPVNYAVVVARATDETSLDGVVEKARLLLPDGTTIDVTVEAAPAAPAGRATPYYGTVNDIVTYAIKGGNYVLTKADTITAGSNNEIAKLVPNSATQIVNKKSVVANSKTVFLLADETMPGSGKYTYKAYTGTADLPVVDDAKSAAAVVTNDVAEIVYVLEPVYHDGGLESIIYIPNDKSNLVKDEKIGDYYEINAYVDGKVEPVKVAASAIDSKTGYFGISYVTNKDGLITDVKTGSVTGYTFSTDNTVYGQISYKDGVLTIAGTPLTANDDTQVYDLTAPGPFEAKSVEDIEDLASSNYVVEYYTCNNVVEALVIELAASRVSTVSVVDGADGYTPVTTPAEEQKLIANIQTADGVIGCYPVNPNAHYRWYYQGSDNVLGTDPVYTVTESDVGKTLCVDVWFGATPNSASWVASSAVTAASTSAG